MGHALKIIEDSDHDTYTRTFNNPRDGKPIYEKLKWIQIFMYNHNIVSRCQAGKLQVSPAKTEYINRSIARHLGVVKRGFENGELFEDTIENADETHFVVSLDNGRTLGFRGDTTVK